MSGRRARERADARVEGPADFAAFVTVRGPALVSMARGLVRHEQDAHDLVQDVLVRALERWGTVSAANDPAAYVKRMLVNAAVSRWRRAVRRERPLPVEELHDAHLPDPAPEHGERDRVLGALRRLPPRHRAVLVMRYYEGLPDSEIADILGVAPSTVRSCAARGLAALRRAGLADGAAGRLRG